MEGSVDLSPIADTLDKLLQEETAKIESRIPSALEHVGREMQLNLIKHIEKDVYAKYSPQDYERRSENNSLGLPLTSRENIMTITKGNNLTFRYVPTGQYKGEGSWKIRHGDELIKAIETGELEGDAPKRPFFQNFIDEQLYGGIMNSFIDGMKPEYKVKAVGQGSIRALTEIE